jgi:hypothetical protein
MDFGFGNFVITLILRKEYVLFNNIVTLFIYSWSSRNGM